MSGRIRTIKPELLEDAVSAGLSHEAFRLFMGVILLADDPGNFRAEPEWLRGQVFWSRASSAPVAELLEELRPLVLFYSVNGQRYGHIRNWAKHQKISHPGKGKVPGPEKSADQLLPGAEAQSEPAIRVAKSLTARNSGESPENLQSPPEILRPDLDLDQDREWEGNAEPAPAESPPEGVPPAEAPSAIRVRLDSGVPEPIPDDFAVIDEHRAYARMHGLRDPDDEVLRFVNDRKSRGVRSCDWHAEFRKWLANPKRQQATGPPSLPAVRSPASVPFRPPKRLP